MSEYKRFISYVYEYPDYQKGANRGFMKVECRNGICQMGFSLRGICKDDNGIVKVYAFRRNGSQLQGSLLTDGNVQSGTLNLQLRFPEEQIGDQNYRIDELSGAILTDKNGLFYATQWDDDPLDFHDFPDMKEENTSEGIHLTEPDPPESSSEIPNTPKPSQKKANLSESPREKLDLTAPSAKDDNPSESDTTEKVLPKSAPEKQIPENSKQEESLSMALPLTEENSVETSLEETIPLENDDIQATSTKEPSNTEIPYFRDGCIINCIQITPKDIRKLQPCDWHLTSNRFVHYGQQMFGHLLIGQLADSGKFVLCVPGIYHQQERALAHMYGFTCFVPCPGRQNCPGNFGYWYRLIQPTNLNQQDTLS